MSYLWGRGGGGGGGRVFMMVVVVVVLDRLCLRFGNSHLGFGILILVLVWARILDSDLDLGGRRFVDW